MNSDEQTEPLGYQAPSAPSPGRTALAFVLAAVVLVGMALGFRAYERSDRRSEDAASRCLRAEQYAQKALAHQVSRRWTGGNDWAKAEAEYRAALKTAPRTMRARRGLAAIHWLRGDRSSAASLVRGPADVPPDRDDVWEATRAAYGAVRRPADPTTLARYRRALEADDLGWSRFVALQALSRKPVNLLTLQAESAAPGALNLRRQGLLVSLAAVGFLAGIYLLIMAMIHPPQNRLPRLAARGGVLIWMFAAGLFMQTGPALLLGLTRAGSRGATDGNGYWVLLAGYAAGAALVGFWVAMLLPQKGTSLRELGWRARGAAGWGLRGYIALIPVLVLTAAISTGLGERFFPHVETPVNAAALMIAAARGWEILPIFLTVCVVGPFTEELLFRGLLFRGLEQWFGTLGGAVLSSAVFAALHPQLPLGFLPIMAIGIMLCLVYRASGSLVACWICHGLNNLVTMVVTLTMVGMVRSW